MGAGKVVGIGSVLVVVLLGVADRGGQVLVERVAAGELQDSMRSPGKPEVDVTGFPFLDDLIGRKLGHVVVHVRDADAGGVKVARIDADLRGVKQAGAGVRVDRISGGGLLTYDALTAAARGFKVSYGGDGLVKVGVSTAGLEASASARPRIVGDELIVKPEKVSSSFTGESSAEGIPTVKYRIRDIPANLGVDVKPTERGVEFTFSGRDVLLKSSATGAALGPAAVPSFALPFAARAEPA